MTPAAGQQQEDIRWQEMYKTFSSFDIPCCLSHGSRKQTIPPHLHPDQMAWQNDERLDDSSA